MLVEIELDRGRERIELGRAGQSSAATSVDAADEREHAGQPAQRSVDRADLGGHADDVRNGGDRGVEPGDEFSDVRRRPGRWPTDDPDDATHGPTGYRAPGSDTEQGRWPGRRTDESTEPAVGCRSEVVGSRSARSRVGASTMTRIERLGAARTNEDPTGATQGRRRRLAMSSASRSATSGTRCATRTFTSTCGSDVIAAAASSASGRPDRLHGVEQRDAP